MKRNSFIFRSSLNFILILLPFSLLANPLKRGTHINRNAKNTLTVVDMNIGDTLNFTLRNGQKRMLILENTKAGVIMTNLSELKHYSPPDGQTLYYFTCTLKIDGNVMTMERYVGSQESFYVPYVVDGMRIWFDAVSKVLGIVNDDHGGFVSGAAPKEGARFVIQDMTSRICPIKLYPLCTNNRNFINIKNCYNGDDCYLGAYEGVELHGGLDIDQPTGNLSYAPFPIDTQYFFNSLAKGDNNNRWLGIHKWKNGDIWILQEHHMLNLFPPEGISIPEGVAFAKCCGVFYGNNEHCHYVFRVRNVESKDTLKVDAWILFWQVFQDNKRKLGEIQAMMSPVHPSTTNMYVNFHGDLSRSGNGRELSYYWAFGDGDVATGMDPIHRFVNPGIYPVTLTVTDGASRSSFTQLISVTGNNIKKPAISISDSDIPSFRNRRPIVMDVYGEPVKFIPHTLRFLARSSRPIPDNKRLNIQNIGSGDLSKIEIEKIIYYRGKNWLTVNPVGKFNNQYLNVRVDGSGLSRGTYFAKVEVRCKNAINGRQCFFVHLNIPNYPPSSPSMFNTKEYIIDNSDPHDGEFYATPYFWVAPRYKRWREKGYDGYYLTNGGRSEKGEYCRFTPDLAAGVYQISFSKSTPFNPKRRVADTSNYSKINPEFNPIPKFNVRVRYADGDTIIRVEPTKSKIIGSFRFKEGMDGYVDILSYGSVGQVLADAIIFKRIK